MTISKQLIHLNFAIRYKFAFGLLLFSMGMTLLFQMLTEVICGSKASLIFIFNIAFWGIVGFHLFQGQRHTNLSGVKRLQIAITTLVINQIIVRFSVEMTMDFLFECGDFSFNWFHYLFSNNLISNLVCFIIFTYNFNANPANRKEPLEEPSVSLNNPYSNDVNSISMKYPTEMFIKDGSRQIRFAQNELLYVEVDRNCILLNTANDRIVLYQSLKNFSQYLDPEIFVQIHRSFIVNRFFIHEIINQRSGDAILVLKTGKQLKVSRKFRQILIHNFRRL